MTTVTGTVVLPDWEAPPHGIIIFTPKEPIASGVLRAPVAVSVSSGSFTATLTGAEGGVAYAVRVECWSSSEARLRRIDLPDIVVPSAGTVALADISAVAVTEQSGPVTCKRGDTLSFGVVLTDRWDVPIDLTGQTVTSQMRGPDDEARDLTVTINADPTTGGLQLSLTAAQTEDLPIGAYSFDVRRERTSTGEVKRSPTGTITITEEITND